MRDSVRFAMPLRQKSVAWAPDGKTLLFVGFDKKACLLDAHDGSVSKPIETSGYGWQGAFSNDGRWLAIGSIGIDLYDMASNEASQHLPCSSNETALAFSGDTRWMASGSAWFPPEDEIGANNVHLWDLGSRARVHDLAGLTGDAKVLFFSPSNRQLCAYAESTMLARSGGEAVVWSVDDQTLLRRRVFEQHGPATSGAGPSSPDRVHLVHKRDPGTVALWNALTGEERTIYATSLDGLLGMALTADLKLLAIGLGGRCVLLYDVTLGAEVARIEDSPCDSLFFSPDGRRLLCIRADEPPQEDGAEAVIWNVADLAPGTRVPVTGASWLARQVATLQRSAGSRGVEPRDTWVPRLASGDGQEVLGVFGTEEAQGSEAGVQLGEGGRVMYVSNDDGDSAWDLVSGRLLWEVQEPAEASLQDRRQQFGCEVAFSRISDRLLCSHTPAYACVRSARDGSELARIVREPENLHRINYEIPLGLSPDGSTLALTTFDPASLRLTSWDGSREYHRFELPFLVGAHVVFSPDGRHVAYTSEAVAVVREVTSGAQHREFAVPGSRVWSVAFSGDGSQLAAAGNDGVIRIWDIHSGVETWQLKDDTGCIYTVCFSPDGRRLASGSDGAVRIWDLGSGTLLQDFLFPEIDCWRIVWAPTGAFIAAGFRGGVVRLYDTRTAEMRPETPPPPTTAPAAEVPATPIPAAWRRLPDLWLGLHRLGIAAPLSLLQDLRLLLAGQPVEPLQDLQSHPGLRALHALRWPDEARCSLLALLLHGWPGAQEWQPPVQQDGQPDPRLLRDALAQGLSGPVCDTAAPPAPLAWLAQSLARVDDRLLTLLAALGPQAAAADPGLPLRLLPQVGRLPALGALQRQLLGLRLSPPEAGPAQGSGAGLDRSGFANQGVVTALVPSQWAYPAELLRWRQHNGGLLYRTRTGREPPQLRPLVIVLDTSPACWGPIEAVTRPAAHALAEALARQQRPALLLTAGDLQVHPLAQPAERLQMLTHRSLAPVDPVAALLRAQALARQLAHGPLAPAIVLLTHCWWGADLERPAPVPGLRALFVQYPGARVRPAFAAHCELWESPGHQQVTGLAAALGRLAG